MKRRREGTLEEFQAETAADLVTAAGMGICGPRDFIRRAERLVKLLSEAPSVRARRAAELEGYLEVLRRVPADMQGWVYDGICAALVYGELVAELRADTPSKQRALTRTAYLANKAKARTKKELASLCGVSRQQLLKWEKEHLR